MASAVRIAGRCLRWNNKGTLSCARSLTDGRQVLIEVKVDESRKLENKVSFRGKVVDDFDGNHVILKFGKNMVKVLPKSNVAKDFAKVKKDMELIVKGQLSQKSAIAEKKGRFVYERLTYISAEDIEFVNYEQSLEKKDAGESAPPVHASASSSDSEI